METKRFISVLEKHGIYAALLLIFFVLQQTPAITLFGVRGVPVIGLYIALAILENEFTGALYGLAAGILCDSGSAAVFGVGAVLFLVCGCAAGLLTMYLINSCPRSAFFLTAAASGIYELATYYVLYGIWGYAGAWRLLLTKTLPSVVLTSLWGLVFFFIVRFVRDRMNAKTEAR